MDSVKTLLITAVVAACTALCACAGSGGGQSAEAAPESADTLSDNQSAEAEAPAKIIILDSHTDTPLCFMRGSDFATDNPKVQVTLPRLRRGGVGAQYLACWVSQGYLTAQGRKAAKARIDLLIDLIHKQVEANDTACALARTADDVYRLNDEGRIAILIGVENGYGIGLDLDELDSYRERGVTYVTLCHTRNNDICDSSSDKAGPRHNGLSDFGYKVVERMNDLGLLIDLSHASEQTFYDVVKASKAPVICSHSGVSAVFKHDRNLTDDQLRAIADADGVVQVCAVNSFLAANAKKANIDDFMRHLLHVIEVAGVDHVGIGTDFDGGGGVPGFNGSDDFPAIVEALRARDFSDADIAKIMGGNYLRVLSQAQSMATR